jgi:hypothetical protein
LSYGSGPGGRWFKSIRPDQFFTHVSGRSLEASIAYAALTASAFWTIFSINSNPKTVESDFAPFANQGGDTLSNFTGDWHAVDSVENGLGKLGYASQDQWFG